jgi:hemoglobin/transferrin/lactoferrin receptor protein
MKFIYMICFSFLGYLAIAQDTEADGYSQSDSTVLLGELVISANKIPEVKMKVSQQVRILTAREIQNLNVQTTADLLSNSGVITMQKSQQGGGSPQLRGFEASRVVLVVDGVRMNNLIYRSGHLQNIITLDNNSLERAEILLGPSSTVYGSDALGGVIHLRTKNVVLTESDKTQFNGGAFFRYGTVNNEKTSHVDVNIGGKQLGSFTSFTYSDFGDLRMGKKINPAYGEEFGIRYNYVERSQDNTGDVLVPNNEKYIQKFSGYSQYDLVQKFLFRQSEAINHSLNVQFSNSSNIPRYDRLTDPEGTGLRSAEWFYGPQRRLMTAYSLTAKLDNKFADLFTATLSYQDLKESRHDRRFNNDNRRNQIEKVDVWGLTLDLNNTWGNHNTRFGFDGQLNQVNSTAYRNNVETGEITGTSTRYPDGGGSMNFYALYITDTYDINSFWTLNTGVRAGLANLKAEFVDKTFFPFPFDKVDQTNSYLSGNAGIIYRPSSWKFSLMTSTGYRVPNIDDLGKVFDTSAGESVIVPNPDVKPEKTVNFDLSVGKFFGDRIHWETTGFYTSFFDAIVVDEFTFNGQSVIEFDGQPTQVLANQNKRRAFITGFSSVLHATLSNEFSADASYNFTYGRIRNDGGDQPLDHIPPVHGRISLKYSKEKFRSELFSNFNGWKRIEDYFLNAEDNEVYATPRGMPSWYTLNVRLGYAFTKNFILQAGADNILDLQYRTFASGINAPGRNFFATARFNF